MIEGLTVEPEWVTQDQEAAILEHIRRGPHGPRAGLGDARRVGVTITPVLTELVRRLSPRPTVATAVWYAAGQRMAPHIDCSHAGPVVCVLGLEGAALLRFTRAGRPSSMIPVPRRALVRMEGTVRWLYQHEVLPVTEPRVSIVFQTPEVM